MPPPEIDPSAVVASTAPPEIETGRQTKAIAVMALAVLLDMAFINDQSEGDTAPLLTVEGVPFS